MSSLISDRFPSYQKFGPSVPVSCVTPDTSRTIHRFFDTSPFSPSGRFLGLARIPYEDRLSKPGDVAQIVVIDLETAQTHIVADTLG